MKISEISNSTYSPRFKAITLTEQERRVANEFIKKLPAEQGKNGLFKLFEPHIEKEAKLKSKGPIYIYEDVLQNLWLTFFTTLATVVNLSNPLDALCKAIDDFKTGKEELNPEYKYGEVSLEKKVFRKDDKLKFGDNISTERALNPLSYRSEDERKTFKNELETRLANSDLTDKEKEVVRLRANGETYKTIAEKYRGSDTKIRWATLTAIARLQDGYNILPQEYEDKAKELITTLNLQQNIETVKQWLIEHPEILPKDVAQLKETIQQLSKNFGIDYETMLECGIKQPSLFRQSPETIEKNVREFVKKFENEGLTTENYLKACITQPSLFCRAPETIAKNVRELVKKFENEGLTTEDYIKVCVKQPKLFYQSPETIEKNVRGLVEKFENEGLTTEHYIKACVKQPQLFYQSPKTIKKNVRGLVEKFENKGLTTEDYLTACVKQPPLFCQSPETIEKNVRELVEKFENEGLTTEDYLKACLKQPQLFCLSPKTIAEHIRAYIYVDKNNLGYKDENVMAKILHKNLAYSTSLIYIKGIILPQLKKQDEEISKLGVNGLKPNMEKYFAKHPDKQFTIKLVEDDMTENCIKTIQEFCNKTFNRDAMFKFEKVAK